MMPPALAGAVVRLFSEAEDRDFLLDDLAERFRDVARADGLPAARRWYWSQALSVVPWSLRLDRAWTRRSSWVGLLADLRLGLRTLRRDPLYAVGVAGTLGIGLAAATITFAVAWKVWLSPMPFPDPDRVVRLYEIELPDSTTAALPAPIESPRHGLSPPLFGDFRAHSWRTIAAVAAVMPDMRHAWIRDGETQGISGVGVTPEFFEILGIVPASGRLLSDVGRMEVVLSEQFWRADLGADPGVVGSAINLNGQTHTVVGVARLPAGYPVDADIVTVVPLETEFVREGLDEFRSLRYVEAIARVRPGRSVAEAKAELDAFIAARAEVHPQHRGWGADAVVLSDALLGPFRSVMALLLAAGVTFLLLATVNVLGLVAARRVEERRDRSIRVALGASEGRLLRGALVESLVLAGIGTIAGGLGAYWLIGPIRSMAPQDVPRLADISITSPFLLGVLLAGSALGLVIGASGYLVSRSAKPSVGRGLVWRGPRVGGRRALVVGQVALTTLLMAGGGAILYRASTLRGIDLGFEPEGVTTTQTALDMVGYSTVESWLSAWQEVVDRLNDRGIRASVAAYPPMARGQLIPSIGIKPYTASEEIYYEPHWISSDYFSVMGIEILAGRLFGPRDHASSMPVAIVSEEFIDQYFPAGTRIEHVVGRVVSAGPFMGNRTVIGVVRSTRHHGPDAPLVAELYVPSSQFTAVPALTLLVRGEPAEVAEAISTVLRQVDPDFRWTPPMPYTSHLKEWFAPLRLQIVMVGVLGALGLLLASLGLYAVMAYHVATRRQELGIRKAVGARDGRLLWGVLANGLAMAAVGVLIGLGAWYQLRPWSRELVDGMESAGYLVPLSVFAVVGCSALLATVFPALRAMRVDPAVTLKAD